MFIKLTLSNGKPILINSNIILNIYEDATQKAVIVQSETEIIGVEEPFDKVINLLNYQTV